MKSKHLIILLAALAFTANAQADNELTLDSCRAMALRNNKQLNVSKLKRNLAREVRKAARTKYLPKVDALGGYQYFSEEISLLSNAQKDALTNLGANAVSGVTGNLSQVISGMVSQGLISPQIAQQLSGAIGNVGNAAGAAGNQAGQKIADAFRTDTKNIWTGAVVARQPIFMGGAIVAMNKMADINEQMTANSERAMEQNTLYDIDKTYWTVVSLRQKQKLAHSYRDLVKKLSSDVKKMIKEGVATRADGLKVDVKVNEAEMKITQVEDGLSLAKMLLCQLCGMPLDREITLADENMQQTASIASYGSTAESDSIGVNRPELRMLQNVVDLSKQATNIIRAEYLPHVLLTGGYIISNPNVFDSFNRHFRGVWNVGLTVHVPVWNWMESSYKIRASKNATLISEMELSDANEKINLQISQCRFKLNEAKKRLKMATDNLTSADENLRCANIGFREGVMETTDVMAAQTAWQQARSAKIDAEVELRLAQVGMEKALGNLR